MTDPNATRTQMPGIEEPSSELGERRPNPTLFPPGNQVARKHGLYSREFQNGQLAEANRPLRERRDSILLGGTIARHELRQMLANSIVMLDHIEAGIGLALAAGITTTKGRVRAAVSTGTMVADRKARLIREFLPLLDDSADATRTERPDYLDKLTPEELRLVTEVLDKAKARAEQPEPPTEPPVHRIRIEVPE